MSRYEKTTDGRVVKTRFTVSQIGLAHMRSMMNSVEHPTTTLFEASVVEQMDRYRETPFYHQNDLPTVFPKVP